VPRDLLLTPLHLLLPLNFLLLISLADSARSLDAEEFLQLGQVVQLSLVRLHFLKYLCFHHHHHQFYYMGSLLSVNNWSTAPANRLKCYGTIQHNIRQSLKCEDYNLNLMSFTISSRKTLKRI
jgi:hypothetical protein